MAIIVFQHSDIGGPGRLGRVFRDHALTLDIRRVDLPEAEGGAPIPPDLDDVEGVISLGGPQDVLTSEPWVQQEIEFLRAAHEAGLPVLGICLGCQFLGKALGAEVDRAARPERGFTRIVQTPAGNTDRVLAGIPWTTWQFQSHEWEVKAPPPGATLLQTAGDASGTKVQAFTAGMRTYGFQYHPEFDADAIRAMTRTWTDVQVESQLAEQYATFDRLSRRLFVNMAAFLFPLSRKVTL
jgi:GMP synthase (glutamine-hydrolysing)